MIRKRRPPRRAKAQHASGAIELDETHKLRREVVPLHKRLDGREVVGREVVGHQRRSQGVGMLKNVAAVRRARSRAPSNEAAMRSRRNFTIAPLSRFIIFSAIAFPKSAMFVRLSRG